MSEAYKKIDSCTKRWGGKGANNGIAEWLVSRFPARDTYITFVDGCVGGASVLLAHDPTDKAEVMIDLDGLTTNFWRVLQRPELNTAFARIVECIPFSEVEFDSALSRFDGYYETLTADVPNVQAAVDFFVVCRQSRSGSMKEFATPVTTRTRRGRNEHVSAWQTSIVGLDKFCARLHRAMVLNGPLEKYLETYDKPKVFIYIDPPYVPNTRTAPNVYRFEMTIEQHSQLLDRLLALQHAKVMISGNPSELYDTKLSTWRSDTFDLKDTSAATETKRDRVEKIWMNY